jgi:transposase InsO family protein
MERLTAEIVLMKTRELYPEAHPRIITDNGSQFISKDFRELISHTITSKRLKIVCVEDKNKYELGINVSDEELAELNINNKLLSYSS